MCIYTVVGGLKATFTSSYLHTAIIYVTMMLFAFKCYASDLFPVGSISRVWDNLQIMADNVPVAGEQSPHLSVSARLSMSEVLPCCACKYACFRRISVQVFTQLLP